MFVLQQPRKTTEGLSLIYSSNKSEFLVENANISRRFIDIDKKDNKKMTALTSTYAEGMYPISLLDKF